MLFSRVAPVCEPARYLDADRRHKSLCLQAAGYEFLVGIRRRFTVLTGIRVPRRHTIETNHRALNPKIPTPT